jgi:hypothetical protein
MAEDCKSGSDEVGRDLGLSPGEGYVPEQCSIRESVGYEQPQYAPELFETFMVEMTREAVVSVTTCLEPSSVTTVPIVLKVPASTATGGTSSTEEIDWLVTPKTVVQIKYGVQGRPAIVVGRHGFMNVTNMTDDGVTLVEGLRIGIGIKHEIVMIKARF